MQKLNSIVFTFSLFTVISSSILAYTENDLLAMNERQRKCEIKKQIYNESKFLSKNKFDYETCSKQCEIIMSNIKNEYNSNIIKDLINNNFHICLEACLNTHSDIEDNCNYILHK